MPMTPLINPPSRSDSANFAARGDSFMGSLPGFVTEANALETNVNAKEVTASNAATTATTQASNASTSATNAATARDAAIAARTGAETARTGAETALDSFDDRYLGPKATAPTLDNDGNALLVGALYWDTAIPGMRAYTGTVWTTLPAATAGAVANTPAGNIAATTVQGAINELDAEKAALTGAAFTGNVSAPNLAGTNTGDQTRASLGAAASGANTDITSLGNNTSTVYATAGTATAYTIAPNPAITAYAAPHSFQVSFGLASGLNPTLQINGIATPPNLVTQQANGTYANVVGIPAGHTSEVRLLSATQALVVTMPPAVDGAFRSIQVFTASGTYTKPAGMVRAKITVVGGGGNGGAAGPANANGGGGGGGGGGGAAIRLLAAASIGATETITVGAAGGTSSMGALASASGGAAGSAGGVMAGTGGRGGAGGIGASGNINIGGSGGGGGGPSGATGGGGTGGGSIFGSGGAGPGGATTNSGAGRAFGGGGGGAAAMDIDITGAGTAGAGAAGVVIIEEFF